MHKGRSQRRRVTGNRHGRLRGDQAGGRYQDLTVTTLSLTVVLNAMTGSRVTVGLSLRHHRVVLLTMMQLNRGRRRHQMDARHRPLADQGQY